MSFRSKTLEGVRSNNYRAYRQVFEPLPLFKVRDGTELLPKLMHYELRVMKRGFCMYIYGAPSGKTGEAKSWGTETLGQAIAPFTFEREDFTRSISAFLGRLRHHRDKGNKYRVIVLDESQKSIPSEAWLSKWNKITASTVSLMRKMQCVAIFIAPLFSWLSKKVRSMVRYGGYTQLMHNRLQDRLEGRLFFSHFSTDREGEEIYTPKLKAYDERLGQVVTVVGFYLYPPTRDLREPIDEDEERYKWAEMDKDEEEARAVEEADAVVGLPKYFDVAEYYEQAIRNKDVLRRLNDRGSVPVSYLRGLKPYNRMSQRDISTLVSYINDRWKGERESEIAHKVGGTNE